MKAITYYLTHLDAAYSYRSGKMTLQRKYRVGKGDGVRTKLKGLLLFNCLVEEAERKCGISRNVSRTREWLTIYRMLFQKSSETGAEKCRLDLAAVRSMDVL